MNIGVTQLLPNVKINPTKMVQKASAKAESKTELKDSSKFGTVFNKALKASKNDAQAPQDNSLKEKVLQAKSVEELLDLLNVQSGEGKTVALDEMLNLEDLTAALQIDMAQLQEILKKFSDDEKLGKDLWDLLAFVQQNAPAILPQLNLNNSQQDVKLTSKQSEQLLKVLKLAELLGNKTDLTGPQENALASLKDLLSQAMSQLTKATETTTAKQPLHGFQQVVQQVVTTKQQETTTDNVVVQPQVVETKTVTITLPAAKPAQSEAFLKEMQALLNKAQIANVAGSTKLAIKLYPENLGSIRIELVQQNGVLSARLLASTALGRELLDQNAHQLKQAFIQQNIQVDRLDIAQALQNPERNTRDQNFLNDAYKQQQNEREEKESEEEDSSASFDDFLIDEGV